MKTTRRTPHFHVFFLAALLTISPQHDITASPQLTPERIPALALYGHVMEPSGVGLENVTLRLSQRTRDGAVVAEWIDVSSKQGWFAFGEADIRKGYYLLEAVAPNKARPEHFLDLTSISFYLLSEP